MTMVYVEGMLRDEIKAHIFDRSEKPREGAVKCISKSLFKLVKDEVYADAYIKGKADALKDLPRWKKSGQLATGQTTLVIGFTNEEDKLYRNGYVISLSDLEKLPKRYE